MKRVVIGKILSPHGVKGQVKLKSHTENPLSIFEYAPLHIGEAPLPAIRKVGVQGEVFIITVEGIATRDEAEKLKGLDIWIDRAALPAARPEEYYIEDLVGLDVFDAKRPEKKIGKILGFYDYGGGNVFELQFNNGTKELLPYSPKFVTKVELSKGFVLVDMPDFTEAK